MKSTARALVAVLVAAPLLAYPTSGPAVAGQGHHRRSLAPRHGVLLGAWVQQHNTDTHYDSVLKFEKTIGRKLAIDHHYRTWDNDFWAEEAKDIAAGRIPLITWGDWGRTSASSIASGSQDSLIREKARAIKALDGPVMLRWGPEMAGGTYGTASEYVAAWRRIHDVFAAVGANNVRWVWCPTAFSFRDGSAPAFYPGGAYVDWIAADGYNWFPARGDWVTTGDVFKWFYEWASARHKPLMIAETGTMEDPSSPGRKAHWYRNTLRRLKAWPRIKAYVYFNSVSPKGYDFRATTSWSALKAFRRLATSRYANP
jgi:hypothetical protein